MRARKLFPNFLFIIVVALLTVLTLLITITIFRRKSTPVAVKTPSPNVNISNGAGIVPVSTSLPLPELPSRFTFGNGPTIPGYTPITTTTVYDKTRGYGFTETTHLISVGRETAYTANALDPVYRDFITSSKPFSFRMDIPNGNYNVTVTIGDAAAPSATTIKAGYGKIVRDKVTTTTGQFSQQTFTINIADEQLKLQFAWTDPKVAALEIAKVDAITLFLAGDSTVCDQPPLSDPYRSYGGWGQMLTNYLKLGIAIANYAASGRTSSSFIAEKRLDDILRVIQPGDYLFIQFGHNDEHAGTGIDPFTNYKTYLQQYIDGARQHQATPVLLTPVARRNFDRSGTLIDTHGAYALAVRQLATEQNVLLIDLTALSMAYLQTLGPEASKSVFFFLAAGVSPDFPNAVADNTHFCVYGAMQIARLVIDAIKAQNIQPLASFVLP